MRIAIVTRPEDRSPKILAETLKQQFEEKNVSAELITKIDFLTRLVTYRESGLNFHFWLRRKISNYWQDRKLLLMLKKFDAVVVSECIPNAFWKSLYNIPRLKKIIKKPVLLFEVYHIENAPTQLKKLGLKSEHLKLYDGYLYVSSVTEVRKENPQKGYFIGLLSKNWGLEPKPKEEILALIDFTQPGYESFRVQQIKALERAGIPYLCLEGSYSVAEIRNIYRRASLLFIQFPEAFGLPILECLNCGVQIFTPNSGWPMSWRLNMDVSVHGPGRLPHCFTVYADEADLDAKLLTFFNNYDPVKTPKNIFETFISHYPEFFHGNADEMGRLVKNLPSL